MKKLVNKREVETLSVFISGKVQGVGFRDAAVRFAHQIKIGGWVRNLDDGRVEALIQGDHNQVDQMISWFLHGPIHAKVTNVEHQEIQADNYYESFIRI